MENTVKQMPLVSIIMPVYNTADFLTEAIESVLTQSLYDIELILVNDGSTDNAESICTAFVEKDKRIKYVYQENSGVSIARNKGLILAVGEYVFFMDSDDTLNKDFIKSSYDVAKTNNSDLVVIGDYFCQRFQKVKVLPGWAQMIRLNFLAQYADVRFPEHIQPAEDGLFSHQLFALTDRLSFNPNGIYNYREHGNQNHVKINEDNWKVLRQIPTWFDILEHFYTKYDLQKSHSLHLARFVEHEPFEFRYLSMPLDAAQKSFLYLLIKEFMRDKVLPYMDDSARDQLSGAFSLFLRSTDHVEFDGLYTAYSRTKKRKLFWLRFIPFKQIRRRLRKHIHEA